MVRGIGACVLRGQVEQVECEQGYWARRAHWRHNSSAAYLDEESDEADLALRHARRGLLNLHGDRQRHLLFQGLLRGELALAARGPAPVHGDILRRVADVSALYRHRHKRKAVGIALPDAAQPVAAAGARAFRCHLLELPQMLLMRGEVSGQHEVDDGASRHECRVARSYHGAQHVCLRVLLHQAKACRAVEVLEHRRVVVAERDVGAGVHLKVARDGGSVT